MTLPTRQKLSAAADRPRGTFRPWAASGAIAKYQRLSAARPRAVRGFPAAGETLLGRAGASSISGEAILAVGPVRPFFRLLGRAGWRRAHRTLLPSPATGDSRLRPVPLIFERSTP
jgi:hypothetical protein